MQKDSAILDKLILREWDEYNLVEDAKLDKYALDIEAERQPELMTKWLSLLHKTQQILNKKQEELEYVEAELRITAKRDGIDGIQKVTDATADAWILNHPRRKEAFEAKSKAYADFQYINNARTVLEHKRDMIKVLDHLMVAGYYSKPAVSNESCTIRDEAIRQVTNAKLTETFNKRKNGE